MILDTTPKSGDELALMLHDDTGKIGTFEFSGPGTLDQPLMQNGGPVVASFVVR